MLKISSKQEDGVAFGLPSDQIHSRQRMASDTVIQLNDRAAYTSTILLMLSQSLSAGSPEAAEFVEKQFPCTKSLPETLRNHK